MKIASVKSARRDKLSIITEVLEIAKENVLKTQIMDKANLSITQLKDYLKFILDNDLMSRTKTERKENLPCYWKRLEFSSKMQ